MPAPDPQKHPLSTFFLSGYLKKTIDHDNFPADTGEGVFDRYELVFAEALRVLGITKESFRSKPEFNFDSGDVSTLEAGIATLRVVNALHLMKHTKISLIKPPKNGSGADLVSEKNGKKICFEVKALTKQSTGGEHKFLEDQLYDKVFDLTGKAKKQLAASAAELKCDLQIVVLVVNWFSQSIYLAESDYQMLVNRLEEEHEQTLLRGINGVLFVTSAGVRFFFIDEQAKAID
ncbi:MAG: hypothetical protein ACLQBK_11880 [Candidatus Sulfotelmatobacter sp.]